MQQEVRPEVAVQRVDDLFIVACSQRGHNQTLGFATGEQGRSVGPGQNAGFRNDVADFIRCTSVDAAAMGHNITAQNRRLELLQGGTKVLVFKLFFAQTLFDGLTRCAYGSSTFLLIRNRISRTHSVFARSLNGGIKIGVIWWLEIKRLVRSFFCQTDDQIDHRLNLLVGKVHRTKHFGF